MNSYADVDTLLRLTEEAFDDTLHALLDADRHAAAEVLRASAQRRRLLEAATDHLRSRPWVPAPQVAHELRYVGQVARVGTVVDLLARHVVEGHTALSRCDRREVERLLAAGLDRLHHLAEGASGGCGPSARGCAATLLSVADHATSGTGDGAADPTMMLCAALAGGLLRASRLAAVA